ncbi:DUF2563 family protein [Mycobacterium sp. Marseille-P9652]|uniref:DUF2563 family protein n=1 Tax=Mycobacterium sp. Marseille-P9652 TaxID=2654950 RepID=UPI0012E9674A|nr:DUF2563 family protein [Mycobacterium sp. Marseille-P9652]
MFVDPKLLRMGGNDSRRAGDHAHEGAAALSRGPLSSGMFGDFAAADAFHEAISSAHAQHIANLTAHHEALASFGTKADQTANGFIDMDNHNAAEMRDVLRQSPEPNI